MSARDIDLTTPRTAARCSTRSCVENAVVQLPGDRREPAARIAGKTIDIDDGTDGATVTSLTANENVQVDLPADGDLPGEADPLGDAGRHRCARRGAAERDLHRQRRVPRDARRAWQPAGGRADRAFTVAHRRNEAGFRRGPAGGLSRQRALHGRSAGCRRRIAGALSCRPRSDRAVEHPGSRSGRRRRVSRRASDRRGARHRDDARDPQADGRHEGPQLHDARSRNLRRRSPRSRRSAAGASRAGRQGRDDGCRGEAAANRSRQCGWQRTSPVS